MVFLIENKVLIEDNKIISQLVQKGFGEKNGKILVLDLNEALFLLENKKIKIKDSKNKTVSKKKIVSLGEKIDKKFYSVYTVFTDLRNRGYVVKTGYKFGFHFRVYPRGKKAGQAHSKWVVTVLTQNDKINLVDFSKMVRLSGNIHTKLLLAVVDSENDISYYETERITP